MLYYNGFSLNRENFGMIIHLSEDGKIVKTLFDTTGTLLKVREALRLSCEIVHSLRSADAIRSAKANCTSAIRIAAAVC